MKKAEELKSIFIKKFQPKHGISGIAQNSFNTGLNELLKQHAIDFGEYMDENFASVGEYGLSRETLNNIYKDWIE